MADNDSDKTEAPTPRRRKEARDNGQIAKSADLTSAALLLAAVLLLKWFGPNVVEVCRQIMASTFDIKTLAHPDALDPVSTLAVVGTRVALALAPIFIGLIVVAVVVNIAQVGFYLSPDRIQPKLESLNPTKGLKKIFGAGQGFVSLGMNLVKMALIATVAYSAVADRIEAVVGAQQLEYNLLFVFGAQILYDLAIRIAILMLVLAIIDYSYQKYKITKALKMTKQEVKDEMKSMDGDPHIKARRRQIAMQRHVQRIKSSVPTADVVVTNPTHYAIALKYDPTTMAAPRVVAKGGDFLAQKIREIAVANGIPLLERPPLARALYRTVEVGQDVPEEYYAAVAEILAYVYEISGKSRVKIPA
ncbi:MAG TPA: flagellar biosynthesis protein FlhB [Tepidisphaeraceae bacterium]|jgi:flagellar biosynthetic protein FlhB